jgi:molybdopterin synthase catalytic subunit
VGDPAVVVGVSCAHRTEAFHACHALIDELKATVPIWKH